MPESRCETFEYERAGEPPVRGYLHLPAWSSHDGLILTHGAGGNCQSPLLVALANAFCDSGLTVLRCDLPFRQLRPHGPPQRGSAERDQQGLHQAVEAIMRQAPRRIFLGGHSYGGRQASMLAASDPALAEALLLLSYPLHPPKAPAQLRTAHFPNLRTPALFVHGARDGFATLHELIAALELIPARTHLLPIESAGHELLNPRNRATLPQLITSTFAAFTATGAVSRANARA